MEEEVKRRFTNLKKRLPELYKRVGDLEPEYYRKMQRAGEVESSLRGRAPLSQYELNKQGEIIAQEKAHVSQLSIELEELKEQVRQMDSAHNLYMEAESLWVRVNEITVKLRLARMNAPAISLEEAKQLADVAHQEVVRLHEREKEIIQEEQATKAEEQAAKARAPLVEAEALEGRIRAAQLNAEAALSRGNRNAYLKAQRDVEQLYKSAKPKKEARRIHSSVPRVSLLAAQQAPIHEMPSPQVNDIRRQILDAQRWHSALLMRVNKLELVPKLEAELEILTAQAKYVSEKAFATDSGSDANLLKFNGVPERELLEMPSGGKRRSKGKTTRRRTYRSKTRHV